MGEYLNEIKHDSSRSDISTTGLQIVTELVRSRRTVERRVIPDREKEWLNVGEILAILAETLASKCRLRVRLEIDLPVPAFIGPGGRAEADEWREWHGEEFSRTGF